MRRFQAVLISRRYLRRRRSRHAKPLAASSERSRRATRERRLLAAIVVDVESATKRHETGGGVHVDVERESVTAVRAAMIVLVHVVFSFVVAVYEDDVARESFEFGRR